MATKTKTAEKQVTTKSRAGKWREKRKQGVELLLPSGEDCLARRRDIQEFVREGSIPNSLLPAVKAAISETNPNVNMSDIAKDSDSMDVLRDTIEMLDSIVIKVVVDPVVKLVPLRKKFKKGMEPTATEVIDAAFYEVDESGNFVLETIPEEERDLDEQGNPLDVDWIYADQIDLEDKFFLFSWAQGGTSDIEKFRAEQASNVESISTIKALDN